MRRSTSMGYTECSTAKRSSGVPMWDSSDPTRAPPSMPLVTDLPNLSPSNSYFRLSSSADSSSPHPGGLERRPSSFINESRILKILEATRDIKSGNEKVIASVQNSLEEFAGLTKQTQDAASGLAGLVFAVEATRGAAQTTVQISSDNFPQILKLLATQQESQTALAKRVDLLLGEVQKLGSQNEVQECRVQQLLEAREAMAGSLSRSAHGQPVVIKSTGSVSAEHMGQHDGTKKQQDQVDSLLETLHEDHKQSVKSMEDVHTNGTAKVHDELQESQTKVILAQTSEQSQVGAMADHRLSKSMSEHHEKTLKDITESAQAEANAAKLRVVELEATVKNLQLQLATQAEHLKSQTQAAELDSKAKLAEAALDAGRRVSAAELRASEAETQRSLIESELKTQQYFGKTIEHHEQDLAKLEQAIETLQAKKTELTGNVSELNTTYSLKSDQLKELELRIESYERRLNQAILDRSKSILGSSTMSTINAGGEHPSQGPKKGERSRTPTSFIRRHLSLRPRNVENVVTDDAGSDLSLHKRNSQRPAKHSKSRSVSLFPDFKL